MGLQAHNCLHFLPSANDEELCFLWASEKTGQRHLYKITARLANEQTMDEDDGKFKLPIGCVAFFLISGSMEKINDSLNLGIKPPSKPFGLNFHLYKYLSTFLQVPVIKLLDHGT